MSMPVLYSCPGSPTVNGDIFPVPGARADKWMRKYSMLSPGTWHNLDGLMMMSRVGSILTNSSAVNVGIFFFLAAICFVLCRPR